MFVILTPFVPLLGFTDVAIIEKEQVKAIVEVKSSIHTPTIFGDIINKETGTRDLDSSLASDFERRKNFLPLGASHTLFTFGLYSGYSDTEVITRLKEVYGSYAIIFRKEPKIERDRGKEK